MENHPLISSFLDLLTDCWAKGCHVLYVNSFSTHYPEGLQDPWTNFFWFFGNRYR